MANTFRTLFGLRSRDSSQDVEVPRTTKQIQEMVDWQNLKNHLDECAKANKRGHDSAASASSGEVVPQREWCSVSTHNLEKELLGRKFHAAHTEVGRRASELQDIVLQLGESDDDECHKAFQIYTQLMKDSTELFAALANKMARLGNKINLSRPLNHNRRPQSRGRASPTTQPIDPSNRAGSTQHRIWVQPKAPEHAPNHGSSYRRPASSSRQNARSFMSAEPIKLHPNSTSSQPVQARYVSNTTCMYEPRSQKPVTDQQAAKAKVLSEAQAKTLGDLPTMQPEAKISGDLPTKPFEAMTVGDLPTIQPDVLLKLEQPNTLPDLPVLSEDSESLQ